MAAEGSRTAFQLFPALSHRSSSSVISTVAVDDEGGHLYVGTSDGQLEEHRLHASMAGARVSLGARKHVGKKVRGNRSHCTQNSITPSAGTTNHSVHSAWASGRQRMEGGWHLCGC